MREGEWGNPDRIGKERPTQPKDCGEMTAKQQEALRIRILESDTFSERFLDVLSDNLTDGIAGVVGYHVGMRNYQDLGVFMCEIFKNHVEKIINDLEPNTTMGDDE